MRAIGLFLAAALAEIGGVLLIWKAVREVRDRGWARLARVP
jgi:drug/metabolite transporter superfamily protein YnfA